MPLEPTLEAQLEEWVRMFRQQRITVERHPDLATHVMVEGTVSLLVETRKMLQETQKLLQVTNQLLHFTNRLTQATYVLLAATIVLPVATLWRTFGV